MLSLVFLCLVSAAAISLIPKVNKPPLFKNVIPVGRSRILKNTRIVGGVPAEPNEWPWQVSVQLLYLGQWRHICGGVLIADQWVLTVAHCLDGNEDETIRVALGEHLLDQDGSTEQHIDAATFYIHENWDRFSVENYPNDIALIRLQVSAEINDYVKTVPYAASDDTFSSNDECYFSGWGRIYGYRARISNVLIKTKMTVLSKTTCESSWPGRILDSHICINDENYSRSACNGDSGGPLVCMTDSGYMLAGVASWTGSGCAILLPNAYTRVSSFRSWIDAKMQSK